MTKNTEPTTLIEAIKASTLFDLEVDHQSKLRTQPSNTLRNPQQNDLLLRGLDKKLVQLWRGGRVVGIGSAEESDREKTGNRSLPLLQLATVLLTASTASSDPNNLPAIYIIAPLTNQTMIPMLHAHLANTLSNSPRAMELLKSVSLLQYFDLAGLAESVAEVSESVYTKSQEQPQLGEGGSSKATTHVLIQGIGSTISATSRHSGLTQANALLASLARNITQLSRTSGNVLVLVEVPVDAENASDIQQDTTRTRTARSIELDSAFTGFASETLRLASGHETLSRTLETGLDCLVVVHDGLGRVGDNKKRRQGREQVVEVIKDSSGDLTGLWDVWREG